jgi:hypothetical protein
MIVDSSYIRTDEDDFGSQAHLLKVRNTGTFNTDSLAKDYRQLNHLLYNQASKESFGLNASEIVAHNMHGGTNMTAGEESMMLTNMSVLGQYLKESELQS